MTKGQDTYASLSAVPGLVGQEGLLGPVQWRGGGIFPLEVLGNCLAVQTSVLTAREGPHDPVATTALLARGHDCSGPQSRPSWGPLVFLRGRLWAATRHRPCVSASRFPSSCQDTRPIGFGASRRAKGLSFAFPFRSPAAAHQEAGLGAGRRGRWALGCPGRAVCGRPSPWPQRRAQKGGPGQGRQRNSGGELSPGPRPAGQRPLLVPEPLSRQLHDGSGQRLGVALRRTSNCFRHSLCMFSRLPSRHVGVHGSNQLLQTVSPPELRARACV